MTKLQRGIMICFGILYVALWSAAAQCDDWPQWGGRSERNMVSTEKGLPDLRPPEGQQAMSLSDPANPYVKWKVKLSANTYGNPTVVGASTDPPFPSGRQSSNTVYGTSLSWLPRSLIVPLAKSHHRYHRGPGKYVAW